MVDHLRKTDPRLVGFLKQQRVRTSDVVIGELFLGSGLPKAFAQNLALLPKLPSPSARWGGVRVRFGELNLPRPRPEHLSSCGHLSRL